MAHVFEATFTGGKCSECGDPINRGDWITYVGDGLLVHEECSYVSYVYDPLTDWDGDEEEM